MKNSFLCAQKLGFALVGAKQVERGKFNVHENHGRVSCRVAQVVFCSQMSCLSSLVFLCLLACWFTRGRGHVHLCPRFLYEHMSTHQDLNPPTQKIHTLCSPCSDAHFGRVTTACVSSPRDWTVSIAPHVQLHFCQFCSDNLTTFKCR